MLRTGCRMRTRTRVRNVSRVARAGKVRHQLYVPLRARPAQIANAFYDSKLGLKVIEQGANSVKYDAGDITLALNRASDYDIVPPDKEPSDYLCDDMRPEAWRPPWPHRTQTIRR
jgi:hypothetical protein